MTAIVILIAGCGGLKRADMIYYTDQNNNTYAISRSLIDFRAMKPRESSSGLYSGGSDKQVAISTAQFKKLSSLAEDLLDNAASHAERREMMTAVLRIGQSSKSREVLLYPSEKRTALESALERTIRESPPR